MTIAKRSFAARDRLGQKPIVAMIADYPRDVHAIDGGVQAVTAYLVKEIIGSGEIDLRVVSFDAGTKIPKRVRQNGVERYLLPRQRLGATTRWRNDFSRLRVCLKEINPSIVHAQGAGIDGYLAVKSKYPSIVTFHGIIGEDARYLSRAVDRMRLKLQSRITEKYCAMHAAHTILISPYVREYYGEVLRGVSHLIPNPVDKKFYDVQRREEAGRILFAGRLIPRKGVTDLVEAFTLGLDQAGVRLVLAGSLADKVYVQRLKQKIDELGIASRVEFLGLLKEPDLLDEFGRAALLVLPSYQETAPMVIQQAMAASIPVVATRICGIPGQVENDKTGLLFEPGDVGALAGHLARLVASKSLREQMGHAARAKALAEYHSERVAQQTLAVYHEVGNLTRSTK